MSLRKIMQLAATAAFALAPIAASAQTEITTAPVANNLYMLQGGGGNIAILAGEDGVFLVDTQVAPLFERITAAIGEVTTQPVTYVLNTHWHHDHTHGNGNFNDAGAVIIAHENVRRRVSAKQIITPPMSGGEAPALPKNAWPEVTFSDKITLHLNGEEIRAHYFASAHTDGDVMVHFVNADALHMGDIYFSNGYPNIDVGSGGNIDAMIRAHEFALTLVSDKGKIIPGHGDLATPTDVAEYINMLKTVRTRVAALIDEGLSQSEVVAQRPIADLETRWGQGYIKQDRMVIQAYKSLAPRSEWED